jgi:UDP-glucose 4-epimerase
MGPHKNSGEIMPSFHVLVTGGCGYIGSHTVVELIGAGYQVTILDNLSNSSPLVLDRIARITGVQPRFVEVDVRDESAVADIFRSTVFDAVIHFAGLKAVGESVAEPQRYYDNNITGSLTLFRVMAEANVRHLVFSSSATVYGDPNTVPIREDFPLRVTNPYGRSKLMVEEMLRDIALADSKWHIALLRYFNPVGAHASGEIGEDPRGIPNNLMPFIAQVAIGRRDKLSIFGNDYPTHDGTGVRDYIHVVDLARGHLAALAALRGAAGVLTVNLGTGQGYSVLDMVKAFEQASGSQVPYTFAPRRPGDIAACFADPSLAASLLGWRAEFGLEAMCRDSWNWQRRYPTGFEA